MPQIATYSDRFGISGAMISAVDLLQGIAKLAGLEVIHVPGATGYYDTDYAAKGKAALDALEHCDLAVVHVEAPDEAGHNGDIKEKIRAIENIDKKILDPILKYAHNMSNLRVLCLPDHPTPIEIKTHSCEPVPYTIWGEEVTGENANPADSFSEKAIAGREVIPGHNLLGKLLNK